MTTPPRHVIPILIDPPACRKCGATLNAHAGDGMPDDPGDIMVSICAYCLCLSVVDPDFKLRPPRTDEEKRACQEALEDIMKSARGPGG